VGAGTQLIEGKISTATAMLALKATGPEKEQ
jgi:hypothetical protein